MDESQNGADSKLGEQVANKAEMDNRLIPSGALSREIYVNLASHTGVAAECSSGVARSVAQDGTPSWLHLVGEACCPS